MGEVIQIHVGQAGVQIANACWELYCLEHGISANGCLYEPPTDNTFSNFFSFKDTDKVVPRTILIDSEPTVIDQIRTGPYGQLYNPATLITGKEDSGSNFARGYYTMGAELIDLTMESIRSVAEACCNLRGFLIFRSIGGGTGSGLGNLIAEQLKNEYDKISKLEYVIFPSPSISPLIVEPYNAMLATHLGMDSMECTFILDNEALYDICAANLNICSPKYKNLNRIIGQIVSTFTTTQRFASDSHVSFSEFQTNLVPYPRIHFPLVSYAPFIPGTGLGYANLSTEQITNACFDPCSQLVRCNPTQGKFMSCVLLYRGKVSTSYINYSLSQLRNSRMVRFVDWQPTGFKVGISTEPPFTVPCGGLSNSNKALLTLSNNTVIHKTWCRLMSKYNQLYSRRAFIHHYIQEGLDEDSLGEASEDICTLIGDYLEVDNAADMSGETRAEDYSNSDKGSRASIRTLGKDHGNTLPNTRPNSVSRSSLMERKPDRNVSYYADNTAHSGELSSLSKKTSADKTSNAAKSASGNLYGEAELKSLPEIEPTGARIATADEPSNFDKWSRTSKITSVKPDYEFANSCNAETSYGITRLQGSTEMEMKLTKPWRKTEQLCNYCKVGCGANNETELQGMTPCQCEIHVLSGNQDCQSPESNKISSDSTNSVISTPNGTIPKVDRNEQSKLNKTTPDTDIMKPNGTTPKLDSNDQSKLNKTTPNTGIMNPVKNALNEKLQNMHTMHSTKCGGKNMTPVKYDIFTLTQNFPYKNPVTHIKVSRTNNKQALSEEGGQGCAQPCKADELDDDVDEWD